MIELIYISNTPNTLDQSTILEILNSSHTKNKLNDLTGHLYYDGNSFLQIIEGEENAVRSLYEKIKIDPRHTNVKILYENEINERAFEGWEMAFKELERSTVHNSMVMFNNLKQNSKRRITNFGAGLFGLFKDSIS